MAEVNHNLLEVIQMAIKLSKLEQHPVGSLWATMSDDDPAVVFGGGVWKKLGECRVLQCADDDHPAGTKEEAGLPDITGHIQSSDNNYYFAAGIGGDGCFTAYNPAPTTAKIPSETWSGQRNNAFSFSASKSNSIYGKSDTVQMKSIYANIWQRVS